MLKANKYRLYPTDTEKELLNKHFGCVRFVYNLALETKTNAYSVHRVNISRYDLQVQLKDLKEDCAWLKEVNSQSLQVALLNLDIAYGNFFKGRTDFPKFKKKSNRQSFNCPQSVIIESDRLYIPKFKNGIKIVLHRPINGVIKSATISKTPTNKYFVSILTDTGIVIPNKKPVEIKTSVGIDLGLKTFAVLSDGTEFENPKHLRNSLERLKVLSRRVSRKVKGSNNRKKAVKNLAILHEKITNQRKDFLHKVTDAITKRYDTLCIEDLTPANMVKNHCLALSISDAGWGMFGTFLKYKSEWRGDNVLEIDRFDPSSKMHNKCGHINKELTLKDREWVCPKCGELVLRDKNAAKNILDWALLKHSGMERASGLLELPTLVGTMKEEKFIIDSLN
jgi:putative transposase